MSKRKRDEDLPQCFLADSTSKFGQENNNKFEKAQDGNEVLAMMSIILLVANNGVVNFDGNSNVRTC